MTKTLFPTLIALCAIVPVRAQAPDTEPSVRYTIRTESHLTTERQMLRDGETMGGGRFGDGEDTSAPTVTKSEVVFEESTDGAMWRRYETVKGSVERPGRDGEPFESEVEGALAGKKLVFAEGKVFENDTSGDPLDERLASDLPTHTDLAALVPDGDLAVDSKFELGESFRSSLRSLVHPIRAAATDRTDDDSRGERRRRRDPSGEDAGDAPTPDGQGGDESDRPRGEGDDPGQRPRRRGGEDGGDRPGGFGRMRRPMGISDTSLSLIAGGKLNWSGEGVVIAHEEHHGKKFAIIELRANGGGEGTAEDLGLGFGRFGRRGQMGGEVESEAEAGIELTGRMLVEMQTRKPWSLKLTGKVESISDMLMVRRETEIEIHTETRGEFRIDVARRHDAEPPAAAEPGKE